MPFRTRFYSGEYRGIYRGREFDEFVSSLGEGIEKHFGGKTKLFPEPVCGSQNITYHMPDINTGIIYTSDGKTVSVDIVSTRQGHVEKMRSVLEEELAKRN